MNVSCSLRGPGIRWKKLSTKINDGSNDEINANWGKAIKGFQAMMLPHLKYHLRPWQRIAKSLLNSELNSAGSSSDVSAAHSGQPAPNHDWKVTKINHYNNNFEFQNRIFDICRLNKW